MQKYFLKFTLLLSAILVLTFSAGIAKAVGPIVGDNPTPTITNISPATAVQGSVAGTVVTVTGTNFISGSNGTGSSIFIESLQMSTTYVSATQLTTTLNSLYPINAATYRVTVFNPAPGGGTSNTVSFTITQNATQNNPLPQISSLSPNSTISGNGDVTITVHGQGFIPSSRLEEIPEIPVTYISSQEIRLAIRGSQFPPIVGIYCVAIVNPAPGGGTSNYKEFYLLEEADDDIADYPTCDRFNNPEESTTLDNLSEHFIEYHPSAISNFFAFIKSQVTAFASFFFAALMTVVTVIARFI